MLKDITRARLIQIWFAAVALVVVGGLVYGASVTVSTAAVLAAVCLVPPAIVLMLWPGIQPPTIAEVLHDAERR
jgi:hypothetical protein